MDKTGPMLTPFLEARAWQVATQIVRRAPAELTLIESVFEDTSYFFHSVVPRDASGPSEAYEHRVVDVNRRGTVVSKGRSGLPADLEEAARDLTLLFDAAPRLYRKLAAELGLPNPRPLPPSTAEALSFRFIVAWLQLHSALGHSYACWQGVDSEGVVRAHYFGTFPHPELASLAAEHTVDLSRWHPAYRFWFLVEGEYGHGPPVACVGSDGIVRLPDGAVFDIAKVYRKSGRGMWAPVTAVRAHLERAGLVSPP